MGNVAVVARRQNISPSTIHTWRSKARKTGSTKPLPADLGSVFNAPRTGSLFCEGVKAALALSSGTAAIHLALKAVRAGPGDLVFCQDLTFAATANPIRYQGARPVFIDSNHTWNMCPLALKKAFEKYTKLGQKPKTVIVVHLYGLSADLDPTLEICQEHGVPLIEDAAESLGSFCKGKATGTIGDLGIYSFNGNKIITAAGGGILVSNDEEKIEKARYWATQAREPVIHYEHRELGYKFPYE